VIGNAESAATPLTVQQALGAQAALRQHDLLVLVRGRTPTTRRSPG
jgi:hypothetical protein